jgi:hypothetical protein
MIHDSLFGIDYFRKRKGTRHCHDEGIDFMARNPLAWP